MGLNTFLEKENLQATLPQLKNFDAVITIDGKYPYFDYPKRYSDDGSLELLKKHNNVILIKKSANQIDKRNKYLEYARLLKYDFLLVVDADFDVKVDWKVFREALKKLDDRYIAYNVQFKVSTEQWPFALLFRPDRVDYHKIHHLLKCRRCGMEIDVTKKHTDNVSGITITHRNSRRSEQYEVAKKAYQAWKLTRENKERRKRSMSEIKGISSC